MRNLRWRERALLAVRLALLAALALLLARPHWRQKPPNGPQRWALLDPTAAVSGDAATKLDQLRAKGYAVHRLASGFPLVDSVPAAAPPSDLWSLLREADAALPAGSTLVVFTPGRLAALHGTRPALRHCRVDWITTPDAAGTAAQSWIESARNSAPVSQPEITRGVIGTSDAGSTRFADSLRLPGSDASANLSGELSSDRFRVRLSGPVPGPWVQVEKAPSTLRLLILHDADRDADARYVEAAARAVAAVTDQPLNVSSQLLDDNPGPGRPPAADWVFWLSARPVPAAVMDGITNLVSDAGSSPRDVPASNEGWIVAPPGSPGAAALATAPVPLWRRVPAALPLTDSIETLWTDGHGEPLLTLERVAHNRHWRFYSRFHPDWTDLPRTAALPALLGGLLFPPSALPADPVHDRRLSDPSQGVLSLLPVLAAAPSPAPPTRPAGLDLHWPWWLLAVLLFAAERLLSRPATSLLVPVSPTAALVR